MSNFDELMSLILLPEIQKRFNTQVDLLKAALAEKDFNKYKDALMALFSLAVICNRNKDIGMEPFQKVFDVCGMILYTDGDELKIIQKTEASEILFKKGNEV